ncbi:hypothetical protein C8Q78DRAFT_581237 [Trametes maxima]|nr:hypothetical protein C8Q78DRAFT_581237 [Trametes maxima]
MMLRTAVRKRAIPSRSSRFAFAQEVYGEKAVHNTRGSRGCRQESGAMRQAPRAYSSNRASETPSENPDLRTGRSSIVPYKRQRRMSALSGTSATVHIADFDPRQSRCHRYKGPGWTASRRARYGRPKAYVQRHSLCVHAHLDWPASRTQNAHNTVNKARLRFL